MNATQMIEERINSQESSARCQVGWTGRYSGVVNRFREAIEHLPCCTTDCECPALHLEGWWVTQDEKMQGERFDVTYWPSGDNPGTPVNDIRTAVCKAVGTTMARRKFNETKGQADFVIEHQGLEVTIKGATTAPNCEIVPVTKTVELTTFEMICPDGEEPEETVTLKQEVSP